MSKVTVIIPSLVDVDRQYLKVCVESLRASGVEWDINVVGNGTKSLNPLVDTPIRGITKFACTKKQGQCFAVNRAVEAAEGDCKWILVSNADMYYPPNWMDNLPDLDDPATPLCFSPNLVEPSDNRGSAPPFVKFNGGLDLDSFKRNEVNAFITSQTKGKKTRFSDGFNLPFFIRLDVWRTIGGYDEAYDPWSSNSDTDLQTLIEIAGVKPKRIKNVLVYHFSEKSGTFDRSDPEKDQMWWNNFNHYRDKFGYTRDDEPVGNPWYCKGMVNEEKLIFHPPWEGKFAAAE